MAKKYEISVQFCAERLMLINGCLDAANKDDKSDGAEALKRLASLWAVDLVDGEFTIEEPDMGITMKDLEEALKSGPLTITQISKKASTTVKEVRKLLQKALSNGDVIAEGEKRSTTYQLAHTTSLVN